MEITEVRITPRPEEKLKAYVDITLDSCFVVHNIRIVKLEKGLRVFMPARKKEDGTYKEIAHPITSDFRKRLEEKILAAYETKSKEIA
ncbi:MAG: hypothetical protein A2252_09360 [Elusimicrobia bacterium RIFOXYA2_FULL_39_19]|nr:MAG: hypothetical protein A2252_09360 [Elusimicrobia bacterium RIFOXYA2_FULL_39_19]